MLDVRARTEAHFTYDDLSLSSDSSVSSNMKNVLLDVRVLEVPFIAEGYTVGDFSTLAGISITAKLVHNTILT